MTKCSNAVDVVDYSDNAGVRAAETPVGIYHITNAFSTWFWLCADHVKTREADGWTCERRGNVDGDCGDCTLNKPKAAQ